MMNKDREGAMLPTQKLKYEPPRIEVYTVDLSESLLAVSERGKRIAPAIFQGILNGQEIDTEPFGTGEYNFDESGWNNSTNISSSDYF